MITHSLIQGSPEWHAYRAEHFNASDAPAMMGCSAYKTRTQLLNELHTGMAPDVDASTQRRFDDGHRFEALARPLAEEIIGDDLYPVVGSEGKLSASFDGLTMMEDVAFEHKTLNDELRALLIDGCIGSELPLQYRVQMEQQCMVSGAGRVLFIASKWDGETLVEKRHCWYMPDAELRAAIVAGWNQFAIDLVEYQPVEVIPAAVAVPTLNLPAVSVQVQGSIALISNLDVFGDALKGFISRIPEKPSTDQEFADCKSAISKLQDAQDALDAAEANALGQIATFDDMRRSKTLYFDLARTTRLALEKLVTAREAAIKIEIMQDGKDKLAEHIAALNKRLGKPYMPMIVADWAAAIKSKRTVSSLQNAVDTLLSQKKIESSAAADKIEINLNSLRELAKDHTFLFADTSAIIGKANDDLIALIKSRIADHATAEAKRIEAETARIREEERIKAEAKAREETAAKAKAEAEAEAKAQAERDAALRAAAPNPGDVTAQSSGAPRAGMEPGRAPEAYSFPTHAVPNTGAPTLTLGKIGARLGFSLTADFLRSMGFEPAGRERAAVLYHEQDWQAICVALIAHIDHARAMLQQAA